MRLKGELKLIIAIMCIIGTLPLIFSDSTYIMHILIMCLIWSGVVVAWDLMMGYAGIFTFGQIAIFVFGAYVAGMISKISGVNPWMGIFIGGFASGVLGLLIGIPCLRLKGVYVALVTFAFHLVLGPLIKVGDRIGTGGAMYLKDVPPLEIGSFVFTVANKMAWFYLLYAVCGIIYMVNYKIINSKFGLAFTALRDSEDFAKTLGVDDYRTNLILFAFTSFYTGILGGFYLQYVSIISTKILGMDTFLVIMVMLIIGGIGRFPGAVIGTFVVNFLNYYLRFLDNYRLLVFGLIVLIAVVFMPQGLMIIYDKVQNLTKRYKKN